MTFNSKTRRPHLLFNQYHHNAIVIHEQKTQRNDTFRMDGLIDLRPHT